MQVAGTWCLTERERILLGGLQPQVREPFAALLRVAKDAHFSPYLISARRSCLEQSRMGSVAPCRSWHVFGHAVDLELHDPDSGAHDVRSVYADLATYWEMVGGTWGGRWLDSWPDGVPGFEGAGSGDVVHFQMAPSDSPPRSWCTDGTVQDCERAVACYDGRQLARAMPPHPNGVSGALSALAFTGATGLALAGAVLSEA